MKAFLIINNFAHDLFTGMWTSMVLTIYLLRRSADAHAHAAAEIQNIVGLFFWLCIVSLGIVLTSGLVRYIYYKPETDGSERVKKGLLIFKHVLFTVIFAGGTFLAYHYAFL
ncbi:MAG: hypothetical protein A2010_03090 [Nitrospirae bacterium GWD2_57_9]|nr:MAG: hypothetical protein A2010_03090 [Nitrospirae bacterium GWD2_57_9]